MLSWGIHKNRNGICGYKKGKFPLESSVNLEQIIPAVRATNGIIPLAYAGKEFLVGWLKSEYSYLHRGPASNGINGCLFLCKKQGKEKRKMKKKQTVILAVALVVCCLLGGIVYQMYKPKTAEGNKEVTITVVHADKSEKEFSYKTDEEYLGKVLLEEGLVAGEESEYGLFVKTVDGETADDIKQQWWCLTEGGEMVNTGIDQTPIEDGDQFELTMTEGY